MNGLRLICYVAFSIFLLIPDAYAASACSPEGRRYPIHIDLNFEIADPYILQDHTFEQINAESEQSRKKWLEDNGLEEVWTTKSLDTLGYASGGMAANYITSAYARSRAYRSYYCAYYRKIEVNIMYRTLIRIPKEFRKGGCVYNSVLEHELRHHKANADSFRTYMSQLQKDLPKMAAFYERTPIRPRDVNRRFEVMQTSIKEAVDLYIQDYVFPAADKINREIDSPESYAAESRKIDACRR